MGMQRASAEAAVEERVSLHLWAAAFAGSLALHLATGAALAPLLGGERTPRPATEITFAGSPAEDAAFTPAVAQAPVESSAAVAARAPTETPSEASAAVTAEPAAQAANAEVFPPNPPPTERLAALPAAPSPAASQSATPALAPAAAAALPALPAAISPAAEAEATEGSRPDTRLAALADAPMSAFAAGAAPLPVSQADAYLAPASEPPVAGTGALPLAGENLAPTDPALPLLPSAGVIETGKAGREATVSLAPAASSLAATAFAPVTQAVATLPTAGTGNHAASAAAERLAPLPLPPTGQAGTASPSNEAPNPSSGAASQGGEGATQVAAVVPDRPATPPSRWESAKTFAKTYAGGPCVATMPAERAGVVSLEGFGIGDTAMQRFTEAAHGLGPETELGFSRLSQAQCEAVDFFRLASARSDFPMQIRIDTPRVEDHGAVIGEILRPIGKPVWLVLVDDEGNVGTVGRLAPGEDGRVFVRVNLTDGAVAARQLLMAISSDAIAGEDRGGPPEPAADFFARLRRMIDEAGASPDIAIAAFGVDPADGSE